MEEHDWEQGYHETEVLRKEEQGEVQYACAASDSAYNH
jgi:hypothetical protein